MSQPRSSFPRRRRPHSTGCCWRTPDDGDGGAKDDGDGDGGADDRGGDGDDEDDADADGDDGGADDTNEELTLTPALGPGDLLG